VAHCPHAVPVCPLPPRHTGRADFPHPAFPDTFAAGMHGKRFGSRLAFWLSCCLRRESVTGSGRLSVVGALGSKRSPLPLTSARIWQGPLAPRALPRFPATMNPADSRPQPHGRLCLPVRRWAQSPLRRVSQVPRLTLRRAPSPTTPESPAGANTRYFPTGSRLHHSLKAGHSQIIT